MDTNNCDNSFELYARHHAPRDTPASNDGRAGSVDPIGAASQSDQSHIDEFNPTTISIISDPQQSGQTPTPAAAAATTTATNQPRPPSITFKLNRMRSTNGSDATDRSDASCKTNRTKGRSTLTSSFLRRKRVEYSGIYTEQIGRTNLLFVFFF